MNNAYTLGDWENAHIKMGRKCWDTLLSLIDIMPYNHKGTSNSQCLPEEWRAWTTHIMPYLLSLPPKGWGPNCLSLGANEVFIHKSNRTIANKEAVIKQVHKLSSQAQHRKFRQKCPFLSFPWKRFDCIIYQLLPENLASNKPTSRCWLESSPELERASSLFPHLLTLVHSNSENQHQLERS